MIPTGWFDVAVVTLTVTATLALVQVASRSSLLGVRPRWRLWRRAVCALSRIHYVSDEGVVFQRSPYSCGVACVQMVLGEHGLTARRDLLGRSIGRQRMSMSDMAHILEQYGLESRGVRLAAPQDLRAMLQADPRAQAVVILESERLWPYQWMVRTGRWLLGRLGIQVPLYRHWAVVRDLDGSKIWLRDPLFGLTEMSLERFQNLWDGITLLVTAKSPPVRSAEPAAGEAEQADKEVVFQSGRVHSPAPVVLERVSCVYEQRVLAVRQVSLELRSGEVFCLLGPNGAGKTTLVKMITGVLPPSSGRVILDGVDVWMASDAERAALRRSIGYMPERPFLYDRLTPREYLSFIGELCGVNDRAVLQERIARHLQALRLEDKADTLIRGLSHGMRRKVAFIAAQLHEPRLLLLDEPTVGLDPTAARLVKDRLRERRDAGHTVLMTTHVLEIAERLADRVGVLDRGTLLFVGTLSELREVTRSPDASLEDLFLRLTEPGAEGVPEPDEVDGKEDSHG